MASCVVVFAYLCLVFGFVGCGISFFAPYWVKNVNEVSHTGLWGKCSDLEMYDADSKPQVHISFQCRWFYEQNFAWEKDKAIWFLSCQVMNSFGIVTVFAVLLVASIHLCCSCCKDSISLLKAIGALLIFGGMLLVTTLACYAGMSYRDDKTSPNSQISRFEWGYYISIPGVILVVMSAMLYLIESCRYDGYHSGHREVV